MTNVTVSDTEVSLLILALAALESRGSGEQIGLSLRPHHRLIADVRRLHRQALRAASCARSLPLLMDGIMIAAGLSLLWTAATS
jgi:hypothetical protein